MLEENAKTKKPKRKKILIAVILTMLLLITIFLINIGVIVLPNFGYKMYFKLNKNSFEEIVHYVEKSNSYFDVDYGKLEDDLSKIKDDEVALKTKLLIKSSLFRFIFGSKETRYDDIGKEVEETTVNFDINNLFNYDNTATAIIYSTYPVRDNPYFYEDRGYWLSYEQIDDNWYLEVWHKEKEVKNIWEIG